MGGGANPRGRGKVGAGVASAVLEQQLYDVGVVARGGGVQRSRPVPARCLDVGAGIEERQHRFPIAALGGPMQRSAAVVPLLVIGAGAGSEELFDGLAVSAGCRQVDGGRAITAPPRVDLSAFVEQQRDDVDIPLCRGKVQRFAAVLGPRLAFDVGTGGDGLSHCLDITASHGIVHRLARAEVAPGCEYRR